MSTRVRFFLADDAGRLTTMPQARWHRIITGQESLPQYAGRAIKGVEATVETERRMVRRVLRVLPFRMTVASDGRVDINRAVRQVMERMDIVPGSSTVEKTIRNLEIDANRFWILNESQWWELSELLGVPIETLRAALYRAPETQ